ncbi:MAG: hypothetical protein RR436_03810 [Clostridia bacterium]
MKFGIIIAMEEEAQPLINKLKLRKEENLYFKLYKNEDIFLIISGIGLSASELAAGYLAFVLECDVLYNIGTCGTTGNMFNHNEIVSIDKVYKRDFNLVPAGYMQFEVPNVGQYIQLPSNNNFRVASCYSSDEFITKKSIVPDNVLVEMEAYSIAYVAFIKKIPCYIYKIVSDFTKDNVNDNSHKNNVDASSVKLADIIYKFIK